jgi:hypothetical protein
LETICMRAWETEEFIKEIQEQRSAGYGFLPVIGAGFSAASGAPLIQDLLPYFQRCIVLALRGEQSEQWHPRTDQWPPLTYRPEELKQGKKAEWVLYVQILALMDKMATYGRTHKDNTRLTTLIEAVGATAEWRTALLFLSRLKHAARLGNTDESAPSLMAPRPEIIDACFRRALDGCHPALNHRMLGVLAGALRLDIYSDCDVESITNFAKGCSNDGQERIVVIRHTNYGLLLLQLYQVIRRNLPPFGGLFPSISRLTLPPLPSGKIKGSGRSLEGDLAELLEKNREKPKVIVVTSNQDVRGITSACSGVFSKMEGRNICLWLDLNDISSTDDLFEVLLEAAYFRLGQENWVPTYHETQKGYRTGEIQRLVSSVDRRWIIFLNARETPGANTGDLNTDEYPNGWLDVSKDANADREYFERSDDGSKCAEEFIALLEELRATGVSVVLMCRGGKSGSLLDKCREEGYQVCRLEKKMREEYPFSELDVAAKAIVWTEGNKNKQRFLHSLVLMQRPRLLATIWSDAVCLKDDNERTSDEKQKWLQALEDAGLARRKLGGFVWLHSRTRELMRKVLWNEQQLTDKADPSGKARTFLEQWADRISSESEIHRKLARWYEKVLDASEAPAAVFEAVTHLCRAAHRDLTYYRDPEKAILAFDAAASLLRTNSFLIQTRGYARGSCRRLIHIRGLCSEMEEKDIPNDVAAQDRKRLIQASRGVQIACTEVMRSNAREVGEDRKAFIRHQQLGYISARDLTNDQRSVPTEQKIWELFREKLANSAEPERSSVEWARWWRWAGMLGSASRSYDAAEKSFVKALQCTVNPLDDLNSFEGISKELLLEYRKQLLSTLCKISNQELRLEALKIVEQFTELLLLKYGLDARLRSIPEGTAKDNRDTRLDEIQDLVNEGRALVQAVRDRDQSSVSHQTIEANWCDCRLLIHQSTLTSRRLQLNAEEDLPRHESVMGILGDAEAGLRLSDRRRHRSELGIVELHRAEARLRKAEAVRIGEDAGAPLLFSDWYRRLEAQGLEGDVREFRRRIEKYRTVNNLQRVRSLATDGLRFLDRSEPILRERRRNVWWTTWFFERYLRLIAISVWTCVFDPRIPVPFLGLEAAMNDTASRADELLHDSLRMISVDAYRLATIIDAYASCAKALLVRVVWEERPDLEFRLKKMGQNLADARRNLDEVRSLREENSALEAPNKNSAMDGQIMKFLRHVLNRSDSTSKALARLH